MKFLKAIIALVLFTLICVSSVGATGIVKFHIPEISNAAVGDTVDATIYVDNNLNPLCSDLALNLDWNNEVIQYVGTDFTTGHTTVAELFGTHQLTINIGDHTNGIPTGDVPAAHVRFKVVGPGSTPIVLKIDNVLDLSGADITSKAVAQNGKVTATGTAIATTTTQTTAATSYLDPGYKYDLGSVQSGGWQAYTMDVTSTDDYDILALVYSQANNFDLYVYDPTTGSVITSATAPYSTENNLDYNWAVSTLNPGKYWVFIHSTSGAGNFAFIHFYNRVPTQRAST
jgi:hypothetical protein